MALQRDARYPGRWATASGGHPQGAFKNRTAPGALDGSYIEQDWANDWDGFFSSLLGAASITPNNTVDAVGASQYYSALQSVIAAGAPPDLLNSTRIDVASAATVNLTTSAPNTRHINITGTTTITGFTVAVGKCYFIRFNAALTLTNGASLVTQSGANIITAAGDTCILRATAANTVEVLCYRRGIPQALGDGQTLQSVTGSRALNTNYTNTTGRSIFVTARATTNGASVSANRIGIQLDGGAEYYSEGTPGAGAGYILCAVGIIPAGAVYRININNATLTDCSELRT